jgi:hypothetical protein
MVQIFSFMKQDHPARSFLLLLTGMLLLASKVPLCAYGEPAVLHYGIEKAPLLENIETADLIYARGSGGVVITNTLTIADDDSRYLRSAIISISSGYNASEDALRFSNQSGITGIWDPVAGILTLSGRVTVASYQKALRTIRYENTNTVNPSPITRVVSFQVNDGTDNSNTLSRNIIISTTGTPPVLANIETEPLRYCLHSGTLKITGTLSVQYTGNLTGAEIRITSGHTSGQDFLRFTNQNGISGSWNSTNGTLTLTGTASVANYQSALRSIRYENTSTSNPHTGDHIVSFTVSSGLNTSNTVTRTITVNSPVTAVISGSASICPGTATDLRIALTGTPPWRFTYRRNSENPVEVSNVMTSPSLVSVRKDGTYSLFEVYDINCKGTVSGSATVEVTSAPDVSISGLGPVYNKQSTEWVPISGNPSGGTFYGPGVIPYDTGWYFVPSLPPVGNHTIVYEYNPPSGNCAGYDSVQVRVLEADAIIVFANERTKYCPNDLPFVISGVNMADVIGTFTVSGGRGLVDHHDNTATVNPALLTPGSYTITYSYFDGTLLSVQGTFEIGNSPVASFTWSNECFHAGQTITFNNTSTVDFGYFTGYHWKIFTPGSTDNYTTADVTRTLPQAGNYRIDLVVETSYGCSDSVTRELGLRPVIQLSEPHYEDFEDSPLSWLSGTSSPLTVNSWKLGNPSRGFDGAASGTKCWYTDIQGPSAPREQSWVASPCFDFTGIEKPMIKLNIWRLFNNNRDGANLQATIDHGKTWMLIGQIDDGINWFNSYSILGNPGNSSVGWSSNSLGVGNDTGWIEARHSLDMLKGKKDVQFRIAYGSDFNAQGNNGIAFDDFRIGERNRMALLEHFTNASYEPSESADAQVNTLANDNEMNIIDLQYHTSFPGPDPFYQDNPSVPNSRVFYYGLSSVPYTILDGGSTPRHRFDYAASLLDPNAVLIESLRDSKFSISLNSSLIGHTLDIEAQLFAQEYIPPTDLTVHLAVIERLITGVSGGNGENTFESVVRAMLPDAAGTSIYQDWQSDVPRYVSHSAELDKYYDEHELRVVAFIQNEATGEVYQTVIDTIGTINAVPGISPSKSERSFTVFPNPVTRNAHLRFYQETGEEITLELYNNAGGLVLVRIIPAGTTETEIPVEQYPEGLYLLRLFSRNRLWGITSLTFTPQH